MDFIEKLKGFLLNPKKTFKTEQKTTLMNAFKYGIIGLVILGVLTALITAFFGSAMTAGVPFAAPVTGASAIAAFFGVVIGGFIGLIIGGLWLHLWVYILGGRKGIGNTIKTIFYAYSPSYVLGWIPVISFLAGIWMLVLTAIGLTQLQNLSTGKAIVAVILAIIIPAIIIIALMAWAISILGLGALSGMEQLSSMG